MKTTTRKAGFLLAALLLGVGSAHGFRPIEDAEAKPAIQGYDVVAYFETGEPVAGENLYQAQYEGQTWWFSSQKHLRLFRKNPERFLPLIEEKPISEIEDPIVDPEAFLIEEDRLLLFRSQKSLAFWLYQHGENKGPDSIHASRGDFRSAM